MRLLVAGAYRHFIYQEACAQALERLGYAAQRFKWDSYFQNPVGRLETKYILPGPRTLAMNVHLRRQASAYNPDVILIWKGVSVLPSTVRWLRTHTKAQIVSYNNDDPFGPTSSQRLWRWFKQGLREYHQHYVFRPINIEEYRQAGAQQVAVLLPYYLPEYHRPLALTPADQAAYGSDIVFVGHHEHDQRVRYLQALVEAGFRVRLFGNNWSRSALGDLYEYFAPIRSVILEDYAKALCGAKLCLSFLSKLNRDTYTRRSFEIPACGRVMVSERTHDLQDLYQEDKEAVFFTSPEELTRKAGMLLQNESQRRQIEQAGRKRCVDDGHDVVNRMREFVRLVSQA